MTVVDPLTELCPRCGGAGEVVVREYRGEWSMEADFSQCGICHGHGYLTPEDLREYDAYLKEQNDDD